MWANKEDEKGLPVPSLVTALNSKNYVSLFKNRDDPRTRAKDQVLFYLAYRFCPPDLSMISNLSFKLTRRLSEMGEN